MQTLVITTAPEHGTGRSGPAGAQEGLVMDGVGRVRAAWGRQMLELALLTGVLVPHNLNGDSIRDASSAELDSPEPSAAGGAQVAGARLVGPGQVEALLADFDLVFLLLSGPSLAALSLPLDMPEEPRLVCLTSQDSLGLVADVRGVQTVVADGTVAARRWHVRSDRVRGFLFGRLCGQMVEHGPALLEWLHRRPQDTESLFYKRARWRPQWPLWNEWSSS